MLGDLPKEIQRMIVEKSCDSLKEVNEMSRTCISIYNVCLSVKSDRYTFVYDGSKRNLEKFIEVHEHVKRVRYERVDPAFVFHPSCLSELIFS